MVRAVNALDTTIMSSASYQLVRGGGHDTRATKCEAPSENYAIFEFDD